MLCVRGVKRLTEVLVFYIPYSREQNLLLKKILRVLPRPLTSKGTSHTLQFLVLPCSTNNIPLNCDGLLRGNMQTIMEQGARSKEQANFFRVTYHKPYSQEQSRIFFKIRCWVLPRLLTKAKERHTYNSWSCQHKQHTLELVLMDMAYFAATYKPS
jgi:hypothetical protein